MLCTILGGTAVGNFFRVFKLQPNWAQLVCLQEDVCSVAVHQLYRSAALPEQATRVAEKELKVGSC